MDLKGYVAQCLTYLFLSMALSVLNFYSIEIYPTAVRSFGLCFGTAFGKLGLLAALYHRRAVRCLLFFVVVRLLSLALIQNHDGIFVCMSGREGIIKLYLDRYIPSMCRNS